MNGSKSAAQRGLASHSECIDVRMRLEILLCTFVALGAGCRSASDKSFEDNSAQGTSFEERLLVRLPEGMDIRDAVVSGNGRVAAYPVKSSSGESVVINGTKGEAYDRVWDLQLSWDGKTAAFLAAQAGERFVVVNGRKGEAFPFVRSLQLSPNGTTVAYTVRTAPRAYRIVVGDRKGEEFEEIDESGGLFSPDGKTFAYGAHRGTRAFVVLGETKGEEFSYVGHPKFSPDGKVVAYEAAAGENQERKFIVVGDRKLGPFDFVLGPSFSRDGKVVYAANRRGEVGQNLPGRPGNEWEELLDRLKPPRGGKWIIGIGGEQREVAAGVDTLSWAPGVTPDGRIYYVAKKGEKECLVLDGKSGPLYSSVRALGFSSDGKSISYIVRLGDDRSKPEDRLVMDGKVREEALGSMESYALSPDGKAVALKMITASGVQVVIGKQKSETYQLVYDLNFSPDGRKLAFCARKGREIWWKVMKVQ